MRSAVAGDVRDGLLAPKSWPVIVVASTLAVAGFTIIFLIAARTAGTTAPLSQMVPLALLVLLAMVLPNVAGWGPREGVTAWAFGAAGLGAAQGVATAVVFGVMVFVATPAGRRRPGGGLAAPAAAAGATGAGAPGAGQGREAHRGSGACLSARTRC